MSLRGIFTPGDIDPLFRLFDEYQDRYDHRTARHHQPAVRSFNPRFDFRESDNAYHLDGELPGILSKDVDIEFSDAQTLVIKGRTEREYHTEPKADDTQATDEEPAKTSKAAHRYWASERSVGEFQRTFSLPGRVDQDAVKASLKDGILSIVVPKSTASSVRKITLE